MVTYMLPSAMLDVRYYSADRESPFADWLDGLDVMAAAKVTTAVARLSLGNLSNVKSVGEGVLETKIDFGPGYRIYFGRDGDTLVILLCGGTKKRQRSDIARAIVYWRDYKQSKKRRSG
ncbi:hypothetical protein I8G32_03947 [Rhodopseudomonas palustris]|uniref:Addiction module killer protein n=2 Tax=Rhodopseudomonas palustris (strain ATCC BAA-98 / CGA009) TaxID=258594 RepID=Q6N368_RHOPA|nr:hypothetical protein I8G32_03947 [Rhodopseudomonas palustris]CAE29267.1 conserved hypothetical protein [Rhodopseudomonas palustris CGA009]